MCTLILYLHEVSFWDQSPLPKRKFVWPIFVWPIGEPPSHYLCKITQRFGHLGKLFRYLNLRNFGMSWKLIYLFLFLNLGFSIPGVQICDTVRPPGDRASLAPVGADPLRCRVQRRRPLALELRQRWVSVSPGKKKILPLSCVFTSDLLLRIVAFNCSRFEKDWKVSCEIMSQGGLWACIWICQ
jgi:hypothetical protein